MNEVDEHNREIGDYYTKREVYLRHQFGLTAKAMTDEMNRVFPREEPVTYEDRTEGLITGNTRRQ